MSLIRGFLGYLYGVRAVTQTPAAYTELPDSNLYPNLYTGLSGCVDYAGLMYRHRPRTQVYECAYCRNFWPQPFSSCATCGGSMKPEPRYV